MKCLELTLPTPEANLACDEALLNACENNNGPEVLRFWEPTTPFVVVGYANRVEAEVATEICRKRGIPILRRCSGGGTVVQSRGCLNYSLILRSDRHPDLESITGTNRFVMETHRTALASLLQTDVQLEGSTDLAVAGLKCSGNAQRRKRSALLFHGTFLTGIDIGLIEDCLRLPSKRPAYRGDRSHREFVRNLPVSAALIKARLQQAWDAYEPLREVPQASIERLVKERYSSDDWNFKF